MLKPNQAAEAGHAGTSEPHEHIAGGCGRLVVFQALRHQSVTGVGGVQLGNKLACGRQHGMSVAASWIRVMLMTMLMPNAEYVQAGRGDPQR